MVSYVGTYAYLMYPDISEINGVPLKCVYIALDWDLYNEEA